MTKSHATSLVRQSSLAKALLLLGLELSFSMYLSRSKPGQVDNVHILFEARVKKRLTHLISYSPDLFERVEIQFDHTRRLVIPLSSECNISPHISPIPPPFVNLRFVMLMQCLQPLTRSSSRSCLNRKSYRNADLCRFLAEGYKSKWCCFALSVDRWSSVDGVDANDWLTHFQHHQWAFHYKSRRNGSWPHCDRCNQRTLAVENVLI